MEKDKKVIYPMMIEINNTVKDTLYYISLPKVVKDKWIELERKSKSNYNVAYNLPTVTLKNMISTYLDGVIDMSPVSSSSDDKKWLVSFKKVNIKIVLSCFKIWIDEFYIKGTVGKDFKRKNGEKDGQVLQLAEELISLITPNIFGEVIIEEVVLFQDGAAVSKEAYQLYPLRVVNYLIGKNIMFKGIEAKLLYSSRNELVTDTRIFHNNDDYYSFLIKLTIQTLPPHNKAYLNVDLSVRRWISRNEKGDGHIYLPNDKNCYIRVRNDRMQSIKTEYNYTGKDNVWKGIDYRCFNECQVDSNIPNFKEVMERPADFNRGRVGDVLIPYEEGIRYIKTSVKAGVTFVDRKIAFEYIKKHVFEMDGIVSEVQAVSTNIRRIVQNKRKSFNVNSDTISIDSDIFIRQLDKAIGGEKATIEIYAEAEVKDALEEKLNNYLRDRSKHEIKCCKLPGLSDPLSKTSNSKSENIPGFEMRVDEIAQKLKKVNTPTIALVAIHDKDYYKELDKKINLDPKYAIRCGFAQTGRLTQFITFEQFEKQENQIIRKKGINEKKKANALQNDSKAQANNRKDSLNKAVEGALLDSFRQFGVVFDYESNKHMSNKKIVGLHVCNYKKTYYGNIPLLPIIITYDVANSRVMAFCELVDRVDLPYWKVILGLSKLAYAKNVSDLVKEIYSTTVYRRLEKIINKDDSDTIIVIDADGTSRRIVKGISNSEIEKAEKNEYDQMVNLLVPEDKVVDLRKSKKGFSLIRIRHNVEVPSYITMEKKMENEEFIQQSGLFKYNNIYYSIDGRPSHENVTYYKERSKATDPDAFSHRNAVEIYPIFVSGDETTHDKNEEIAVGIIDMLREASIQFTAQKTILPLPLHLAEKMEEYI